MNQSSLGLSALTDRRCGNVMEGEIQFCGTALISLQSQRRHRSTRDHIVFSETKRETVWTVEYGKLRFLAIINRTFPVFIQCNKCRTALAASNFHQRAAWLDITTNIHHGVISNSKIYFLKKLLDNREFFSKLYLQVCPKFLSFLEV